MIWNVVGQIVSTGFKVMQTRSQTKQVKAMAEQKHYERMLDGKIEYEIAKQNQMDNSWRDEWFTIILSLPLLIVFGSIFLDWYIYALLAAIASSFGLKVTDLAIKKFKKK